MGATRQPSVLGPEQDEDPRAATVARVLDWHHRHPLAARLRPHAVDSIGLVAVPFLVPAEAADADPVPARTPVAARRGWLRAFDEQLVEGLSPARLARWALRHGSASRPAGGALRVREVVLDSARAAGDPAGTTTVVLWLHTARLKAGSRTRRLLVAPDGSAVLGRRVWAPTRGAAAAALLCALLGAAAWVPQAMRDDAERVAQQPSPGAASGMVGSAAPAANSPTKTPPNPPPNAPSNTVPSAAPSAATAAAGSTAGSTDTPATSATAAPAATAAADRAPGAATATTAATAATPASTATTPAGPAAAALLPPPSAVAQAPALPATAPPALPATAAMPAASTAASAPAVGGPRLAEAAATPSQEARPPLRAASVAASIRPHLVHLNDAAAGSDRPGPRVVPKLDDAARAAARAAGAEARRALAERRSKDPAAYAAHAANAPNATAGATTAPTAAPASPAATADARSTAGATDLATAPAAADTVWALSTRVTRTRFESEQVLVAMRHVARQLGPPDASLRYEVLPAGADYRGVSWPFPDRRSAERVRSQLQARGVAVELVAF
jgi:hypothetical protein